jgi:hypothetical protein
VITRQADVSNGQQTRPAHRTAPPAGSYQDLRHRRTRPQTPAGRRFGQPARNVSSSCPRIPGRPALERQVGVHRSEIQFEIGPIVQRSVQQQSTVTAIMRDAAHMFASGAIARQAGYRTGTIGRYRDGQFCAAVHGAQHDDDEPDLHRVGRSPCCERWLRRAHSEWVTAGAEIGPPGSAKPAAVCCNVAARLPVVLGGRGLCYTRI